MQLRVLQPAGTVQLPGGQTIPLAASPSQASPAPSARTALLVAPTLAAPVRAATRVLPTLLEVTPATTPTRRTVEPTPTAATSVGLQPGGGTNVTSTPANLLAGPEAVIDNFTIISLDSGTW
jgi:hypothetical protein